MPAAPGLSLLQTAVFARRFLADPRGPMEECTRRYGPIWQSRVPGRRGLVPLVFLMGREGNERVLAPQHKDDFTWFEGYRFTMEPLFGQQILLLLDDAPGGGPDLHRQRHRLLIPAFHPRLDDEYLAKMAGLCDQQLDAMDEERGGAVDLQAVIKRLTFSIVAQLLLGAAPPDLPRLTHLFEQVGQGLFSLVHLPLPGLPFDHARRARQALDGYLQDQLTACRRGEKSPPPLLAGLLTAQAEHPALISDAAIIAELISFLYAGYDTTASMLTQLVVALGHPDNRAVYTRLAEAIRSADSAHAAAFDCSYLDAVLLEGERLGPPLLFLMRGVRRDISFGGYDIKAGSKVAYSPYYTHRMPELFPEPLRFRPERFIADNGTVRRPSPYTLLGFGAGHRTCIGKRLAGLEMRLFLARLLRRFDYAPRPENSDALYFNPAPQRKHGYLVELRPWTR